MPIRSFRSRRVKTSALTLRIIADAGYWSDSSVCSQRSDFISYNSINFGWLFAPRKPYHLHPTDPFRRGELRFWEIPISAAILPFITSTMKVLGLPVMKALFRILYAESKLTGKPIVFLGHPIELVRKMNFTRNWKKHLIKYTKPKYFSPSYIRIHGIQLRSLLYRHDEETFARYTGELFTYMNSYLDVNFMSIQDYSLNQLEGK